MVSPYFTSDLSWLTLTDFGPRMVTPSMIRLSPATLGPPDLRICTPQSQQTYNDRYPQVIHNAKHFVRKPAMRAKNWKRFYVSCRFTRAIGFYSLNSSHNNTWDTRLREEALFLKILEHFRMHVVKSLRKMAQSIAFAMIWIIAGAPHIWTM